MTTEQEIQVCENKKIIVTKDALNYIVREKPIDLEDEYKKAKYFSHTDVDGIIEEICED